jgi:glycosyltransferase involved in cell wall biosynthesis
MSNKVNLLIYTIVYNESRYLPLMLDSLLSQTDQDFTLLISDNHSTDETPSIIENYSRRFSQINVIKPDNHLSGIEHGHFAYTHVTNHHKLHTHVMFLGGHDIIGPDTIRQLKERAAEAPESALLYTDTFRLNLEGETLERYPNSLNTAGVSRPLIPFVTLFGIGHNIMSSGIWRADVFASAKPRYVCCAADHLLLCEAALSGAITHTSGGALYLRDAPTYTPGWSYYVKKHIPETQRIRGCVYDFSLQISWLISILERCIGGSAPKLLGEPVYENYFLSAMQLYFIRYGEAAQGFDDYGSLLNSELYKAVQSNNLAKVLQAVSDALR